jgi:hypothetical protein
MYPGAYAPPPSEATAASSGSASEAVETLAPNRPKRLDWTKNDEEKLVLYLPVTYLFGGWFLLGFIWGLVFAWIVH